ncbi:DUF2535 family protein [Neobacillus sp. 179-C4.2 HS]|uniref:DUF2535 family protein n=1 Tax=Neobacillus driksii TaxID=3035913 RepID=A0ABV4Z2E7_9BACI|nr:DUF2535 family protein [Neobacillus sp. 179.-C4.2 HS]MDP5196859.1 DUF2535 family protein [Neobacillus sp. 179.-C4.2 HS]
MLCKSLEFTNTFGQKIKIMDIPVLDSNHQYYFLVQVRLQRFISLLNGQHQEISSHSFREHMKRKMNWVEFKELYSIQVFKNNA